MGFTKGYNKAIDDFAEKIINLISLIFFIWILLSFFDILAHNMTDYNYASWNAIEIFYRLAIK